METEAKGYNLSIPVNNFHLSYDDVGEGSIPIIVLHRYRLDKTMWKAHVELLKSTYR
ncbi:hypothetical protein MASR2M41_18470 [Flammeovirgaceae bacterium]